MFRFILEILKTLQFSTVTLSSNCVQTTPLTFQQVNKVELMGRDKPDIPEGVTESRRVAIGIVVALIIVFLITSICMCVVRMSFC